METLSLPIAPGEDLNLEVGDPRPSLLRWTKVHLAQQGTARYLGATDWERHVFGTLMKFLETPTQNEKFVSFWLLSEAHGMFYQARCSDGTRVKVIDGNSRDAGVITEFTLTPSLREEWRRRLEDAHRQIQSATSPFQKVYSFKQYLSANQALEALRARGVKRKAGAMAIKPSDGFKPFVEQVKKITSKDTRRKEAGNADASIAKSMRELEEVIREAGIAEQKSDYSKYQNPKKTKDEAQKELAELAELRRQLEPLK